LFTDDDLFRLSCRLPLSDPLAMLLLGLSVGGAINSDPSFNCMAADREGKKKRAEEQFAYQFIALSFGKIIKKTSNTKHTRRGLEKMREKWRKMVQENSLFTFISTRCTVDFTTSR
jgi:uncharacterized membrane protein YqgA involved in biofilm formation